MLKDKRLESQTKLLSLGACTRYSMLGIHKYFIADQIHMPRCTITKISSHFSRFVGYSVAILFRPFGFLAPKDF